MSRFVEARDFAVVFAQVAVAIPDGVFEAALEEAERSMAVGPILDPTLFNRARTKLEDQVKLIEAAADFRRRIVELRDEIAGRAVPS